MSATPPNEMSDSGSVSSEDGVQTAMMKQETYKPQTSIGEILTLQEQFWEKAAVILTKLSEVTEEKSEQDGLLSMLTSTLGDVKSATVLLQNKILNEVKDSRSRELEWQQLGDLFQTYRTKVNEDMTTLKEANEEHRQAKDRLAQQLDEKERELATVKEEFDRYKDLILRLESTRKRRLHLEKSMKQLADEENALLQDIDETVLTEKQQPELSMENLRPLLEMMAKLK